MGNITMRIESGLESLANMKDSKTTFISMDDLDLAIRMCILGFTDYINDHYKLNINKNTVLNDYITYQENKLNNLINKV